MRRRVTIVPLALALVALLAVATPATAARVASVPAPVAKALSKALLATGALPAGAKVEVLSARSANAEVLAAPSPRVELRASGWRSAALTAKVWGNKGRWAWVRFQIRVTAPIAVAARDLPRGHTVGRRDVKIVAKPLRAHDKVFASVGAVVGQTTRSAVRRGRPLFHRRLAEGPEIATGTALAGVLRSGGVTLRFALEALQRGRVGQIIRAKVIPTGKVVRARLTGARKAEVL